MTLRCVMKKHNIKERKTVKGYRKLKAIEQQYSFIKLTPFIILGVIVGLLLQLLNLVPTVVLQKMIDEYLPTKQIQPIIIGILLLIIVPVIVASLTLWQKVRINSKAKMMGNRLSVTIFNKLLNQTLDFYQSHNSNELLSYCNKNFYSYLLFWMSEFPGVIVNVAICCVYFVWLSSLHVGFAVILLLYIPLLKIPSDAMSARVGVFFKEIMTHNARSSEIIGEAFKGIKTVKLNHFQPVFAKELQSVYKKVEMFWNKVVLFDNMSGIWMNQLVSALFKGLCLGLGLVLILNDQMSIGKLLVIFTISGSYFSLMHQIIYSKFSLSKHEAEHEQLFQYLDLEEATRIGHQALNAIQDIEFENVSFAYDEKPILKDLNLQVTQGSWVGLVGESGIGKSTLLDLLVGIYSPTAGEVLLNKKVPLAYSEMELSEQVVYLSQHNYLFSGTVEHNLRLANPEVSKEQMQDVLKAVSLDVALDSMVGEDGSALSQGEKQRLIIAQGLLKDASLYLLDEMTSHLDVGLENQIRELFKNLQKAKEITIISVSHRYNFLSEADTVYELSKESGIKVLEE